MQRYWKGSDMRLNIHITDNKGEEIPLSSILSMTIHLFTIGCEYVEYNYPQSILEDEKGLYIPINENALAYLPDGFLRWEAHFKVKDGDWADGKDIVKGCRTDIFVKTPRDYVAKPNVQEKEISITENGDYEVLPDAGYEGISSMTINVEIPFPLEVKEVSITENESTTTITTGEGYSGMSEVAVNVKVPMSIKVGENRIKLSNSTFTEVPQVFDFSDATDLMSMFENCFSLTIAPEMNTSEVTNMKSLFTNCNSLTTVPSIDTSKVTTMYQMFANCYLLTSVPEMNTSNVTDMYRMFFECHSLTTVPLMDTSKVTDMGEMFNGCRKLTSIPPMDTSDVTNMPWMFYGCYLLTTVPELNTSNVTNMYGMFQDCSELTSVPEMNVSNVTNMWYMFDWCKKLTDLGGLVGLKCDLDLSPCPLTHDSLMNVINKAADVTAAPVTLTLGANNLAKLTDTEKGIATSKGWTLA